MTWKFWEWFGTPVARPTRKPRAKIGRGPCPICRRDLAFSLHTGLTARHVCVEGRLSQTRPDGGLTELEPRV